MEFHELTNQFTYKILNASADMRKAAQTNDDNLSDRVFFAASQSQTKGGLGLEQALRLQGYHAHNNRLFASMVGSVSQGNIKSGNDILRSLHPSTFKEAVKELAVVEERNDIKLQGYNDTIDLVQAVSYITAFVEENFELYQLAINADRQKVIARIEPQLIDALVTVREYFRLFDHTRQEASRMTTVDVDGRQVSVLAINPDVTPLMVDDSEFSRFGDSVGMTNEKTVKLITIE